MVYRQTVGTERHKEERREQIFMSARSLVAERGFAGTRAKDIARKSGVAEGTVFRHFPTLVQLFVEIYRRVAGHEIEVVKAVALKEASTNERLSAVLRLHLERALRRPGLARALVAEPLSAELESVRLVYRKYFQDVFADIMRKGIAAGEYHSFDVEMAAACMTGAMDEALILPILRPKADDQSSESRIEFVVQFCLHAIAPWRSNPPTVGVDSSTSGLHG